MSTAMHQPMEEDDGVGAKVADMMREVDRVKLLAAKLDPLMPATKLNELAYDLKLAVHEVQYRSMEVIRAKEEKRKT